MCSGEGARLIGNIKFASFRPFVFIFSNPFESMKTLSTFEVSKFFTRDHSLLYKSPFSFKAVHFRSNSKIETQSEISYQDNHGMGNQENQSAVMKQLFSSKGP